MLPLDQFLEKVRAGQSKLEAFCGSIQTQYCDFDYEAVSQKWELLKGMEGLVKENLATRQRDPSQMFSVYKYSKATFWDNKWGDSPWLTKARGLVLDVAGNIVSHSFEKCFNYKENGTGEDFADDLAVLAVDKLNGFLGIVSSHPLNKGELLAHTQGGFSSDFTGYIRSYLDLQPTRGKLGRFLAKNDVTLMFEVLHPEDPHIIAYEPEMMGLHLIGVRGKNLSDQAWPEAAVDAAALEMELRRPSWERTTFGELKSKIRAARTEGWMVRRDDAEQETLLKIKTPYYLTTKFLGRLSQKRIAHLYGSPKDFKKTVDEEFYPLVDMLVKAVPKETLLEMNDDARVVLIRGLINEML